MSLARRPGPPSQFDPRCRWDDVEWIKKRWGGKLILKGILDAEDAQHRGRQRRRRDHRLQPRRPPARRRALLDPRAAGDRRRGRLDSIEVLDGRRHPLRPGRAQGGGARREGHPDRPRLPLRPGRHGRGRRHAAPSRSSSNELDLTMALCGRTDIHEVDRRILLPGTY